MRSVRASLFVSAALLAACSFDPARLGGGADAPPNGGPDGPVADGPVGPMIDADPLAPDARLVDAAPPDASPPDADPPDAAPPAAVGSPCATATDCGTGRVCLDETVGWAPEGFCTLACTTDAECGAGNVCSTAFPDSAFGYCFPDCPGGGACADPNHVCGQLLNGTFDLGQHMCHPGDPSSVDGAPCVGFYDCDVDSICANNPFDNPGGYCAQLGCTVGDDETCSSGGDATCIAIDGVNVCVDTCGTDADCRVAEGYDCTTYWTPLCTYPHQNPGDACTSDATCGEPPWDCLTGASWPGGYCGAMACDPADASTCPSDALCYDATPGSLDGTEWCGEICDNDFDCRMGSGYSCQDSQVAGVEVCRL